MSKDHSKHYSESSFWEKVADSAKAIGKRPLLDALKLFYAMKGGKATPAQIVAIIAALGYFISPIDAVPDALPGGLVDDAGVMQAAVLALSCCADPEVIEAAKRKLAEWFN